MADARSRRLETVYDADSLKAEIDHLAHRGKLGEAMFRDSQAGDPARCQGDIVRLDTAIPAIGATGQAIRIVAPSPFWMIIGNTCDFDRPAALAPWTQVVPIRPIKDEEAKDPSFMTSLRIYETSRTFYLPPWPGERSDHGWIAELLRPVALNKDAALNVAQFEMRMTDFGWALLHACLVRFLARDDGRYD